MLPIPEFVRPIAKSVIGIPGRFIPYPVQKQVLSLVLNQAFREPLHHGELDFLEGAKVRIKVTDLNIDWLQRRIRVEGDTELGLGVKNTMDSMDWDDLPLPLRRLLQGISLVIEKLPKRVKKE